MTILYNFGIIFFSFLIRCFSFFNKKAKLLFDGRKNTMRFIESAQDNEKSIWFHCSSLGEFEQARPMIEKLKQKCPKKRIVVTFFSPSGYEVRKNYEYADEVLYLPSDTKRNAIKMINAIHPEMVIFIKYEFWFNYLSALHKNKIPTYIVSAIFRKEHIFFKWYGKWFRKMLSFFTKMYIQDEESGSLLKSMGIENYVVCGDTRFDRVFEISQKANRYSIIEEFVQDSLVLIGGSTWPDGERLIANYIERNQNIKLIIAPHEIHEEHLLQIEKLLPVPSVRFSKCKENSLEGIRVLIVDTMGMLSSIYQYGHVAYIGGGFGSGIHNTIEASTFGLPVLFGPNYKKYQEACDLINVGAGFSVLNQKDFDLITDELLLNENSLKKASALSRQYVEKMRGATEVIVRELFG